MSAFYLNAQREPIRSTGAGLEKCPPPPLEGLRPFVETLGELQGEVQIVNRDFDRQLIQFAERLGKLLKGNLRSSLQQKGSFTLHACPSSVCKQLEQG